MIYASCPKCGHAPLPADQALPAACPACGLIFQKYLEAQLSPVVRVTPDDPLDAAYAPGYGARAAAIAARLLEVSPEGGRARLAAGAVLWLIAATLGWRYARMDIALPEDTPFQFLHASIIPFHEFGHILFSPFGEFMHVAGGSLMQFLMPLCFGIYFVIWKRNNLAGWLMLWWEGYQWVDLAPYCYDAKIPTMVLLTGRTGDTGGHDYIDMLGDLGLLNQAQKIGGLMQTFGSLLFAIALLWGAALLWREWQNQSG